MSVALVLDRASGRPACVLLQAALGGDMSAVSEFFDPDLWLLDFGHDWMRVRGTRDEWRAYAKRLRQ